jgi:phenylpyruvate tautomerase PptA (4-oxalocrotonate tautomerase family)
VHIVRIDIQTGKSTAYKREILHSVREALASSLGASDDRIASRLIETPADNIDAPETRSDRLTMIEVTMLPSEDPDAEQKLYAAIVARLGEKPGIHQHDITVVVREPAAECFAIGGVMQCTLSGISAKDTVDEEL